MLCKGYRQPQSSLACCSPPSSTLRTQVGPNLLPPCKTPWEGAELCPLPGPLSTDSLLIAGSCLGKQHLSCEQPLPSS